MKPKQIAKLLLLVVDEKAKPQDRHWAKCQLIDAKENMNYDDFDKAVNKVTAKNRRLQTNLNKRLSEFSLQVRSKTPHSDWPRAPNTTCFE